VADGSLEIPPVSPTHATAIVDGVRLHYVRAGRGDPVVLLHGWPQTCHEWRKVIPALAARYTVIAPDLRGLGDSEKTADGYDRQTLAQDVRGLVRGLGFDRIFLVGHDLGGPVASAYAEAHPGEVRRLAILEIPAVTGAEILKVAREQGIWHMQFHAVPDVPEALVAGRERAYFSWFFRGKFTFDPSAITEADMDEYVRCYAAPGGLRAGFAYYRALVADDSPAGRLTMPVLALGGERSLGGLVLEALKPLADDLRGGTIARAGHWLAEEQPDELARQLVEFFGEDDAKPR